MTASFNIADFKDEKTLGFQCNDDEFAAPAPPPYKVPARQAGPTMSPPLSPPHSPPPLNGGSRRSSSLRQWVGQVVRPVTSNSTGSTTSTSPRLPQIEVEHPDIRLAHDFRHNGDTVLVADGVGFQVESRVLCAASATLETLIGRQKQANPSTSHTLIVPLNEPAEDVRDLLSVIVPYAFPTRPSFSVARLTTIADLFDTYRMRGAARFGLGRLVEASSASLDALSVDQCVAWARLAHTVRSIPTLKKALGISAYSALREYWLLPEHAITALQPHLYRALVLAGNTYSLLGEEGLASIHFKYLEGQLCLANADGDVVTH